MRTNGFTDSSGISTPTFAYGKNRQYQYGDNINLTLTLEVLHALHVLQVLQARLGEPPVHCSALHPASCRFTVLSESASRKESRMRNPKNDLNEKVAAQGHSTSQYVTVPDTTAEPVEPSLLLNATQWRGSLQR